MNRVSREIGLEACGKSAESGFGRCGARSALEGEGTGRFDGRGCDVQDRLGFIVDYYAKHDDEIRD